MMVDLAIIMPTYNKAKYIAEALDSVFSQRTSYSYEIVVADDYSTDGTLDIVSGYEKAHPGVIRILRSDRNLKLFRNILRVYADLKTPYFCVLDPDDYWTDDDKVQRALDYLESHRDCTIFVTDSEIASPDGARRRLIGRSTPADSTFADYLAGRSVCGCSLGSVFRNVVFSKGVPDKLRTVAADGRRAEPYRGDAFRTILHLHEGRAHYEPVCDAVYRVTEEGLWQGIPELKRELLNAYFMCEMNRFFDGRYPRLKGRAARHLANVDGNWARYVGEVADSGSLGRLLEFYGELRDEIPRGAALRAPRGARERLYWWLYRRACCKLSRFDIMEG